MKYGNNYTLKFISKENGKILFDIIDESGKNLLLIGEMKDLRNILYYSDSLTPDMSFNALQDAIFQNPVVFVAKRKPLKNMNDLDFNL